LHGLNPKVYTAIFTVILIVYPVRQSGEGRKGKDRTGRTARTGQRAEQVDRTIRTGLEGQ
jgi:hypothetical protein